MPNTRKQFRSYHSLLHVWEVKAVPSETATNICKGAVLSTLGGGVSSIVQGPKGTPKGFFVKKEEWTRIFLFPAHLQNGVQQGSQILRKEALQFAGIKASNRREQKHSPLALTEWVQPKHAPSRAHPGLRWMRHPGSQRHRPRKFQRK